MERSRGKGRQAEVAPAKRGKKRGDTQMHRDKETQKISKGEGDLNMRLTGCHGTRSGRHC